MIPPRQHAFNFTTLCLLLALGGACWAFEIMRHDGEGGGIFSEGAAEGDGGAQRPVKPWSPAAFALDPALADGLRAGSDAPGTAQSEVAARYRLVGVMPGFGGGDAQVGATAIIETRASGAQQRLRVGGRLEPLWEVASVERRAVWLRGPGGMERLTPDDGAGTSSRDGRRATDGAGAAADKTAPLRRFGGSRLGEGNWEFKREAIMGYYQELLDQPERLLRVFDSLAPVYNEARAIEGYRVNIEGEADFFAAADLRQNDVVRKVNGIEMTNRRRAENLIRRFAQDDLDIVVLELERDGASVKQVYEMR